MLTDKAIVLAGVSKFQVEKQSKNNQIQAFLEVMKKHENSNDSERILLLVSDNGLNRQLQIIPKEWQDIEDLTYPLGRAFTKKHRTQSTIVPFRSNCFPSDLISIGIVNSLLFIS